MRLSRLWWLVVLLLYAILILFLNRHIRISNFDDNVTIEIDDLFLQCVRSIIFTGSTLDNNFRTDKFVQNSVEQKQILVGKYALQSSPVTVADKLSQCNILYDLKQWFPSVMVFSEEDVDCTRVEGLGEFIDFAKNITSVTDLVVNQYFENKQLVDVSELQIWLDPLDASKEFTEGIYEYTSIMLGISRNGIPIVGIVYFPFTKRIHWGIVEESGSTQFNLDNDQISNEYINNYHILISRSHSSKSNFPSQQEFNKVLKHSVVFDSYGGSGFKACWIFERLNHKFANGGYIYLHLNRIMFWDLCAVNAIARARGLWMSDAFGHQIIYPSNNLSSVHTTGVLLCDNNTAQKLIVSKILEKYLD